MALKTLLAQRIGADHRGNRVTRDAVTGKTHTKQHGNRCNRGSRILECGREKICRAEEGGGGGQETKKGRATSIGGGYNGYTVTNLKTKVDSCNRPPNPAFTAVTDFGDEAEHDAWLAGTPTAELWPAPEPVRGFAVQYWRAGDALPPAPPRRMVVPGVRTALAARDWLNTNGFGPVSISGPDRSPCAKGCIRDRDECRQYGCRWYRETFGKGGRP